MARRFTGILVGLLGTAVVACEDDTSASRLNPMLGRQAIDRSEVDVEDLPSDAAVQQKILSMSFEEAVARLGALTYTAKSDYVFGLGNEEISQEDTYLVEQDSQGNFHVRLDTEQAQIETFLVNDAFYVRQDWGRARQKARQQLDAETWGELAWSPWREVLGPFTGHFRLGTPKAAVLEGRATLVFPIEKTNDGAATLPPVDVGLPLSAFSAWREGARVTDIAGSLTVDKETGVVLATNLRGRLSVQAPEGQTAQLTLRFAGGVSKVAKTGPIVAPPSRAEFKRHKPARDPLSFFRQELPAPDR